MRSRIITSPSFDGEDILGSILFEDTMDREIGGHISCRLPLVGEAVVPFLKVDKGLAAETDGVQLMNPIPTSTAFLSRARGKGVVRDEDAIVHHARANHDRHHSGRRPAVRAG